MQICTLTQTQARQHPTTQFFTGWMPFMPLNQENQSTEGIRNTYIMLSYYYNYYHRNAGCNLWQRWTFPTGLQPTESRDLLQSATAHCNIISTGSGIATWVSGSSMNWGSNLQSDLSDKEKFKTTKFHKKVCKQWNCNLQHRTEHRPSYYCNFTYLAAVIKSVS